MKIKLSLNLNRLKQSLGKVKDGDSDKSMSLDGLKEKPFIENNIKPSFDEDTLAQRVAKNIDVEENAYYETHEKPEKVEEKPTIG